MRTFDGDLSQFPPEQLAKFWCQLNSFEWPVELLDAADRAKTWDLMCRISAAIGDKACNREWNRDRMTDEEHERWWANREQGAPRA